MPLEFLSCIVPNKMCRLERAFPRAMCGSAMPTLGTPKFWLAQHFDEDHRLLVSKSMSRLVRRINIGRRGPSRLHRQHCYKTAKGKARHHKSWCFRCCDGRLLAELARQHGFRVVDV